MFIIAMVKQSGNTSFEGFWEQQEASSFWSELCTKMDSKLKGDRVSEIHLYKTEASSIADGIKQAKKGQLDVLKSHKPANTKPLREVVRLTGEGLVDDKVLDAANKALYAQADQFLGLVGELIKEFAGLVDGFASGSAANDEQKGRLNEITYEVKIQGGTFNYPLFSLIGAHLEKFLAKHAKDGLNSAYCVRVLQAYVSTLEFVIEKKISGTGGELGKKLLARLQAVIKGETESFEVPKVAPKKPVEAKPAEKKAPAAKPTEAKPVEQKPAAKAPAAQAAPAPKKPAAPEPGVQSQESLNALFASASREEVDDNIDPNKVTEEDFEFKDAYRTGCTAIDEDHRYLLHLVKHLYLSNKGHAGVFETDMIFLMLEGYSRIHFGREELVMEKFGHGDLEDHKAGHEKMLEQLLDVREQQITSVEKNRHIKGVLEYKQIYLEHIILSDFGYKKLLKNKDAEVTALLKDYDVPKSWLGDEQ
ncbi:hypothetical protein MTBPR1_20019 [Candidatus Terasakiella magnetica]|uniref:Hemerythrin-like domain-containing protein n=1 Tax=Candidatus Terasakiella magnetica TaxID=1867952 RepID=A0A1C3RFZ0_9PROT|nr:hemerythrin domain-containing protein [Candidatus Terasakiella magnetica]SCA56171.1 hypothetical protein MTBPR1_20019 [Candidatus Terasakiella magnetica]